MNFVEYQALCDHSYSSARNRLASGRVGSVLTIGAPNLWCAVTYPLWKKAGSPAVDDLFVFSSEGIPGAESLLCGHRSPALDAGMRVLSEANHGNSIGTHLRILLGDEACEAFADPDALPRFPSWIAGTAIPLTGYVAQYTTGGPHAWEVGHRYAASAKTVARAILDARESRNPSLPIPLSRAVMEAHMRPLTPTGPYPVPAPVDAAFS